MSRLEKTICFTFSLNKSYLLGKSSGSKFGERLNAIGCGQNAESNPGGPASSRSVERSYILSSECLHRSTRGLASRWCDMGCEGNTLIISDLSDLSEYKILCTAWSKHVLETITCKSSEQQVPSDLILISLHLKVCADAIAAHALLGQCCRALGIVHVFCRPSVGL